MSGEIFFSLAEAEGRCRAGAWAIGNFDGVHVGHCGLVKAMGDYADAKGIRKGVLTFHPHPTVLVAPDRVPPMLCTLEERIQRLRSLGVGQIMVLPFTEELSLYSPERFVSEILIHILKTEATFVGTNFHFGYQQAGTPTVLSELGRRHRFETAFLDPVRYRGEIVSSSAIRKALLEHRLAFAGRLLGRCFSVSGAVVTGQGIGRRETVPTLNLLPSPEQLLLPGVFITRTFDLGSDRQWPSITNVGTRPTFEGAGVTIESFLLGPLTENAPTEIRVEFRRFVREERAFDNPQALKQQIMKDVARAQVYWRRMARVG